MRGIKKIVVYAVSLCLILSGCQTTGSGGGFKIDVGPVLSSIIEQDREAKVDNTKSKLDVIIPVFDPGLPNPKTASESENTDERDVASEEVWPELRRAEANRFAYKLKEALDATGAFGAVRVTPDTTATGDLYLIGKIDASDGEEVEIEIKAVDISGREWFTRYFDHEVEMSFHENIRNKGKDPYAPVFTKAANRIAIELEEIPDKDLKQLKQITELRFGANMNDEAFARHLNIKDGRATLVSLPSDENPMLRRVRTVRVRDQMFVDSLQSTYRSFSESMDTSYLIWQKQSLEEMEARSEADKKAAGEAIVGILAIGLAVAAAAAGAGSGNYNSQTAGMTAGIVGGAVGAQMLKKSFQTSAESEVHSDAIRELGESINVSIAPQVVEMEQQTVELTGTAKEQFAQWRSFLKKIYAQEKTPEKTL